jgi:hypothetical protein
MTTMKPKTNSPGHGWRLLLRTAAAVFGGYALASAASIFLAGVVPQPRGEAALVGLQFSFAIYTSAVIWVFAVADLRRVWLGLLGTSALLAAVGWLLLRGAA